MILCFVFFLISPLVALPKKDVLLFLEEFNCDSHLAPQERFLWQVKYLDIPAFFPMYPSLNSVIFLIRAYADTFTREVSETTTGRSSRMPVNPTGNSVHEQNNRKLKKTTTVTSCRTPPSNRVN